MEHVEVFLNRLGLGQYAPAFEANGYDTLDIIFIMDDDDFERFGPFIGMLPGHLYRLKKAVHGMKNQSKCDSNVSVVPIVQLTAADTVANASATADTSTADVIEEISPVSSPEIIVDELTPDQNEKKIKKPSPESSPVTAAAALKQQLSPPTPMRPNCQNGQQQRGPKKNFLARQAALDAKLNVLRIRAEKSKTDDIHIEMSDDEEINK